VVNSNKIQRLARTIDLISRPEVLIQHDHKIQKLARLAKASNSPHWIRLLEEEVLCRIIHYQSNPDPFLQNLPPDGTFSSVPENHVPLGILPNGETVSIPIGKGGTSSNVLVVGPTGYGKTTFLLTYLHYITFTHQAIIVAFDRKGDLFRLVRRDTSGQTVGLQEEDLKIAPFERFSTMNLFAFIALLVEIIAGSLGLEASKRLLSEVLYVLYQEVPKEICLSKVVSKIDQVRAHPVSRMGQYKEAMLFALGDLLRRTGDCLNYITSNFLSTIFSEPRTYVISCGNFSPSILSLIISLFYFFIYEVRRLTGQNTHPVILVVDDAMNLIFGSLSKESEHEARPFVDWTRHGRSLDIGATFGGQNFSEISPIIKNNCQNIVCLGGTGQDALEIARFMNLNSEQAAIIPQLTPGQGIVYARGQWPLALKCRIPNYEE
jgi:GTPase SAR1 family protein